MKILLQGPLIVDRQSPYHQKVKNVLIQNGRIVGVGDKKPSADKVIEAKGMILSPGWFDWGVFVGDPGLEQKEDLESLADTAVAGGFTEVAVWPNTEPVVQSKNAISYLIGANASRLLQVHPLAAVSKDCMGEELTEMIDLHQAGAIGFTDGLKPIWQTDLMLKSLQYLQKFEGLLIARPEDIWLNKFGQMHEGVQSTMLGLKGMPRMAEEICIRRDLELLRYAGGRLHFSRLSSGKSFELIRVGKKKLNISCDVTSYQALLVDKDLHSFDTNFKVNPPLREKVDQDAIIKALKDGTIDVICSGHTPHDEESKAIEFDYADFGMINMQTFAANLVALSQSVDMEILLDKCTHQPRRLLGRTLSHIEVDEKANLTLMDPNCTWTLNEQTSFSKSSNSPWWGKTMKGKVKAVFGNNKQWLDK